MSQRTLILMATAATAFVLVAAGGVTASIARAAQAQAQAAGVPATATVDPAFLAAVQAREAEYQTLIAQANAQLEQAYAKQRELEKQLSAPRYPITADQAILIAQQAAPNAVISGTTGLVSFQGVAAYEIVTDKGKIYVGATAGNVLYNGAAAAPVAIARSAPNGESGGESGGD